MRPFDEEVEESVLHVLRRKGLWPCFKGTDLKIGMRGLQIKGYWEKKRSQSITSSKSEKPTEVMPASKQQTAGTRKRQLSESTNSLEIESVSTVSRSSFESSPISMLQASGSSEDLTSSDAFDWIDIPETAPQGVHYVNSKLYQHNEFLFGRLKEEHFKPPDTDLLALNDDLFNILDLENNYNPRQKKKREAKFCKDTFDPDSFDSKVDNLMTPTDVHFNGVEWHAITKQELVSAMKNLKLSSAGKPFIYKLLTSIMDFIPEEHLSVFTNNIRVKGFETFMPKYIPLMDCLGKDMKYLFSKEFCLPQGDARSFDQAKPIGTFVADITTFTVVDADDSCRTIYRGKISGVPSLALRVHKLHSVYYLREILTELRKQGEMWCRSIEYRCDGTVMVVLKKYFMLMLPANTILCAHQDVTAEFQHVL